MGDAYIVTSIRTPGCKKGKGAFRDTRPEDLLSFILQAAVEKTPNLTADLVEDVMVGCCFPEAEQGLNIGRIASQIAGFPVHVPGATVNRFCSSGLEAIAISAMRIMAGWSDIVIGGGVESMTFIPMGGHLPRPHPEYAAACPDLYTSMGITAENVARRYGVPREAQDEFACQSQMKAAAARDKGLFREIVPTPAAVFTPRENGVFEKSTRLIDADDGIRPDTTLAGLAKLTPAFALDGTVTAGNSSQMTDGAAATVLMSEAKVAALGVTPLAKFKCYTTVGCRPDEMGVGPLYAIPKLLEMAGLTAADIDLFEINEAFAAQAVYCLRELGLDKTPEKINLHGGAVALGHPLGCTGAKLTATLVANMRQKGARYGVVSMCIGGGMGAAALLERCD